MRRLFLAVLVLLVATLTIPTLREHTAPYYDRFGQFVAEKLEGPLGPVLNPWRRLRSQSEIGEVVTELVADRNQGFVRPRPDVFMDYMQSQVEGEDGLDAWGSPYILVPVPQVDSVSIVSAGPDLEYQTDDDIVVTIRFGEPAYMRRSRRR